MMKITAATQDVSQTSDQGDTAPRQSRLSAFSGYVERMFLLFSVYTLSIGPMYWEWVGAREVTQNLWIAAFYEPLRRLGMAFPLFGEWLNWYVRLWIL